MLVLLGSRRSPLGRATISSRCSARAGVHQSSRAVGRRPDLRPSAPGGTGGQSPPSAPWWRGATRGVTPRQACPRPEGLGRNLRSKTRWFTGFCNSHQVSHFATFFIDARAEISVAESRSVVAAARARDVVARAPPGRGRGRARASAAIVFLGACRAGVGASSARAVAPRARGRPARGPSAPLPDRSAPAEVRGARERGQGRGDALRRFAVVLRRVSTMILPQVHLRKPCYDFSFL